MLLDFQLIRDADFSKGNEFKKRNYPAHVLDHWQMFFTLFLGVWYRQACTRMHAHHAGVWTGQLRCITPEAVSCVSSDKPPEWCLNSQAWQSRAGTRGPRGWLITTVLLLWQVVLSMKWKYWIRSVFLKRSSIVVYRCVTIWGGGGSMFSDIPKMLSFVLMLTHMWTRLPWITPLSECCCGVPVPSGVSSHMAHSSP